MPLVSALERRAVAVWMFVGDMIWFFGSAADKACTKSLQVCSSRSVAVGRVLLMDSSLDKKHHRNERQKAWLTTYVEALDWLEHDVF
jgi:hypothetical protein